MMAMSQQQQDALTEAKPRAKDRDPRGRPARQRVDPIEIGRLFEKLPPHAIEAEMSLLGSMLLDPQVIGEVVQIISKGEDFFKPAHGAVFDAIVELYDEHSRLDLVTLHQLMLDRGVLEAIGGEDYLAELAMSVPSAAHAEYYARLVRDKAIIRQLIGIAGEIIFDAYNSPDAAQEILDNSEHRIFQIAERYDTSSFAMLHDLLAETLKFVQETDGPTSGLLTGFHDYDELTGGLQNGELTILAARPAMGKTALALNIAEQIASGMGSHRAANAPCPVGIFSLEMGKGQLAQRLVSARAGVDVQKLRRNMINRDELPRVRDACLELSRLPMLIDDVAAITLLQIRAKARRMKAKHDIKAIFVDYLQLVSVGHRTESRQIEVSEISRGLKALSRELEIPVVVLSQLNRNPENREGHRPRLSDLRESGSIEQDADVVLLLHREDYYHKDEDGYEPSNVAELIIAKQRNGPTGTCRLQWDSRTTRFHNLATYAVSSSGFE
jgi:replicative DNA helicase